MTSISLYKVAIKKGTCCGKIEIFCFKHLPKTTAILYFTEQSKNPTTIFQAVMTMFAKRLSQNCSFFAIFW